MPQMAPMNWLMLATMFVMIFFMFIVINYYSSISTPKLFSQEKKQSNFLNWKW
uniref:ATP synthase F0 subunit 8 n=1 Tax=Julodis variolaris TaxID=3025997 RepID=UPI0023AAED2C|nr:ATP synthase F0 subunit 8 [Julodis variolaris]WCO87682.1 ATP synthase F0 subunit 8 [Julodis variolaris]